jgi:hypothetical protein
MTGRLLSCGLEKVASIFRNGETMIKMMVRMLAMLLLVGATVGCQDDAGPAEEAGKNIDDAMEEAGESIKEMGESIQEEAERD